MSSSVAAGFVHRMTNVAGTIPVRVEQIRERLNPAEPGYQKVSYYLDAINEDSEGILKTANAIKSSNLDAEVLELASVDTLVSTAIQRITPPHNIAILKECEETLPQVLVFSFQLVDALENIIRNGLEAIEGSGTVTVVGREVMEESVRWVLIDIKDTGCGISPENLSQVFDLFFTTKPGGMGFALWRARTLVESLGGKITVASEVGSGTTFTILLPVA